VEEGISVTEDDSVEGKCRVLDIGFETDSFTDRESKYKYVYNLTMNIILYYSMLIVVSFLSLINQFHFVIV
jgi:hypothetical protein